MKRSILYLLLTVSLNSLAQANYDHGIFNGKYVSTYSNGNKKAIGKFKNNQRVGDWEFYTESGEFAARISYVCNTEFKTQATDGGIDNSLSIPLNDFDQLFLLPLDERDIKWSKRLYRDIPVSEFKLASDFNFFEFVNSIPTDKGRYYTDDMFKTKITAFEDLENSDQPICGYRIKLDYFFRKDYIFMDARIVGIAPLYKTEDGKIHEICWLYYHGLKDIVFEKIVNTENRSMETILQTRSYHSTIFKELDWYGKTVEEQSTNESEREKMYYEIDKSIIEVENDLIIKSYF